MKSLIIIFSFLFTFINVEAKPFSFPGLPEWVTIDMDVNYVLTKLKQEGFKYKKQKEKKIQSILVTNKDSANSLIKLLKFDIDGKKIIRYWLFIDIEQQVDYIMKLKNMALCTYSYERTGEVTGDTEFFFRLEYDMKNLLEKESTTISTTEYEDRLAIIKYLTQSHIFRFDDCQVAMRLVSPDEWGAGKIIVMEDKKMCE